MSEQHELLELMHNNDIAALDVMTRQYGDRLLAVGRRYCRNEEEAQDAVQDALISAGTHLQQFRGDGSVEGWLVRMVANACARMRRGRKNDPSLHTTETTVIGSGEENPESLAERDEMSDHLGEALLTLQPRDRLIVLLSEAEGWTGPQIAEELDMTPGSVRTRLSRARKKLQEELARRIGA